MKPQKKIEHSPAPKPYEAFLRSVQLIALGMNRSASELRRGEYLRLKREKQGGQVKFTSTYGLDHFGKNAFDVAGAFTLVVEDPDTKESALRIEAEYRAHLHAPPPIDRALAEQFAQADLRLILWPFFRQYVFETTGNMGIAPITMPLSKASE